MPFSHATPCPGNGTHGVCHWVRVLENRLRLATFMGAHAYVVKLLAIFHDSCRVDEDQDRGHG